MTHDKVNYLQNKSLITEIAISKEQGQVTDNLAKAFMQLVKKLSSRGNFNSYTYREEFEGDAIIALLNNWHRFDSTKSDNPFSYFTTVAWNSFVQRLNKEKKQHDIKAQLRQEYAAELDMSTFSDQVEKDFDNYDSSIDDQEGIEFVSTEAHTTSEIDSTLSTDDSLDESGIPTAELDENALECVTEPFKPEPKKKTKDTKEDAKAIADYLNRVSIGTNGGFSVKQPETIVKKTELKPIKTAKKTREPRVRIRDHIKKGRTINLDKDHVTYRRGGYWFSMMYKRAHYHSPVFKEESLAQLFQDRIRERFDAIEDDDKFTNENLLEMVLAEVNALPEFEYTGSAQSNPDRYLVQAGPYKKWSVVCEKAKITSPVYHTKEEAIAFRTQLLIEMKTLPDRKDAEFDRARRELSRRLNAMFPPDWDIIDEFPSEDKYIKFTPEGKYFFLLRKQDYGVLRSGRYDNKEDAIAYRDQLFEGKSRWSQLFDTPVPLDDLLTEPVSCDLI